jgi:hypothetical protein
MIWLCWLIFLLGAVAFSNAWRRLRATSLTHALVWAVVAWLAWGVVVWLDQFGPAAALTPARYVALCLVGCAGSAVLGARRPGVAAWDFVVLGLLAVFLLFLAEGAVVGGELQLGPVRTTFLALTLALGIANYLPTRLVPAALLAGAGCGWQMWELVRLAAGSHAPFFDGTYAELLILCVPPAAAACAMLPEKEGTEAADRLWRAFRDRFGLIWGLRLREQFNRAAANAALPLELGWGGLRAGPEAQQSDASATDAALAILRALLKRFGPETPASAEEPAAVRHRGDEPTRV